MEAILATVFGGVLRLAPDILKWFDRKDDRKHEIAMFNLQIKSDSLRASTEVQKAESQLQMADIQALMEVSKIQGQQTGVKWVDAINAIMRPLITFWWAIVLYTVALACGYISLLHSGVSGIDAILQLWGDQEKAIAASCISFWLVDRVVVKGKHV